jgi:NADH-quinone oxidoreductase subunit N
MSGLDLMPSGADLNALWPVWALSIMSMVIMLVSVFPQKARSGAAPLLALIGLAVAAWGVWNTRLDFRALFNDMYRIDPFSTFFAFLFIGIAVVSVLLAWDYLQRTNLNQGEYYALILLSTLGMMFMASANDLIMIFRKNRFESNEAALKYFLLGAFATGFLLYGVALVYGTTGTTNLTKIGAYLVGSPTLDTPLFMIGALLLFVGFAFKVSLVPFHMWTPDAYEGAPTTATAFMSAGAKAAGFAGLLRVGLTALPAVMPHWVDALTWLAILTMTVGNVIAILQSNLKRMLAYSAIAHAGYVMLGVIAGGTIGATAVIYYVAVYSIMNLGAFGIVSLMGRGADERVRVQDLAGAGFRHPWLGVAMTVFMLGLAGIPPTAGFIGKLYLFSAALSQGHVALVVVAVLNSVAAVYYYLRPVVVMYMTQPEGEPLETSPALAATLVLGALVVATFWLGVLPAPLSAVAFQSVLAVFP